MDEKKKKRIKLLFVSLSCLLCVLVITAVVQTFVLKGKQNQLSALQGDLAQVEQQLSEAKEKHDNIFSSDITDTDISPDDLNSDYKDEYIKHEGTDENGNPYGEEGEKVIVVG